MEQVNEDSKKIDSNRNSISPIIKNLSTIGIVLYASGFFIEAIHFSEINLTIKNLVSPRFILTGITFWAIILLGIVFSHPIVSQYSAIPKKTFNTKFKFFLKTLGLLLGILTFCGIVYYSLFTNILDIYSILIVTSSTSVLIYLIAMINAFLFPSITIAKINNIKIERLFFTLLNNMIAITVSIPIFIGYITTVYNEIPTSLGGGLPRIISFKFKNNYLSFKPNPNAPYIDTIKSYSEYILEDETENDYYILVNKFPNTIMDIPKNAIESSTIVSQKPIIKSITSKLLGKDPY